jgi:hypothetical protein
MTTGSWIGPLASLGAIFVAYLLGRYGKKLDFRFEILQKCSTVYFKALMATGDYRKAVGALHRSAPDAGSEEVDPFVTERKRAEALEACLADAASLSYLIERLFNRRVRDQWSSMAVNLMRVRHPRPGLTDGEVQQLVDAAHDAWEGFVDAAATQCGFFPWTRWGTKLRPILSPQNEEVPQPIVEETGQPGIEVLRQVRRKLDGGTISEDEATRELIMALRNGAISAKEMLSGFWDFKHCPTCGGEVEFANTMEAPDGTTFGTVKCKKCSWYRDFSG